jgi:serine/threonine protein kinase
MNEATLLAAALEKPSPEERAAFLPQACAGDERLRRRVEALLRAHAEADDVLNRPLPAVAAAAQGPPTEAPGTVIGPYRLLEQIGTGGFGVVYLAEQTEPVRRKVALKILKPGMDTRHVVARFEAERQALALTDHPNIAKVLDAGTVGGAGFQPAGGGDARKMPAPQGRPYFVMELVKGIPITDYCDQCGLTTPERLELFRSVCRAVQHAHQKGVIHRDVKPTNVLVAIQDGKPIVKVIDFGVAKAINQRLSEHTLVTGFHQMIGTPLYMSPEQAEMSPLDVDTRADIYSLGVLLYELLTSTTPFTRERFKQATYDEIRRIIQEQDPPKPSARLSELRSHQAGPESTAGVGHAMPAATTMLATVAAHRRTEPRQLLRTVRGELDWIVMKCLEKDRNRRYETASSLAKDIDSYLHNEPLQACPPSTTYRLRKFVVRNKGPLLIAGSFTALLVVGLCALVAGLVAVARLNSQLDDRNQSPNQANKEMADALAREPEELAKTRAALEAMTKARARARQALSRVSEQVVEESMGRKSQLSAADQKFLREMLPDYETFANEMGDTPQARELRAEGHFRIGTIQFRLRGLAKAETAFRAAMRLYKDLAADFPGQPEYRQLLAQAHSNLGIVLRASGRVADAAAAHRDAPSPVPGRPAGESLVPIDLVAKPAVAVHRGSGAPGPRRGDGCGGGVAPGGRSAGARCLSGRALFRHRRAAGGRGLSLSPEFRSRSARAYADQAIALLGRAALQEPRGTARDESGLGFPSPAPRFSGPGDEASRTTTTERARIRRTNDAVIGRALRRRAGDRGRPRR